MESYIQLLLYLAGPAIIAVIVWVWALWVDHNKLKLHISENYIKKDSLENIESTIRELRAVCYEIAAKVGVSIHRPF